MKVECLIEVIQKHTYILASSLPGNSRCYSFHWLNRNVLLLLIVLEKGNSNDTATVAELTARPPVILLYFLYENSNINS